MPTTPPNPPVDAGLTVRLLVREPYYRDRDGRPRTGRVLALLAYLLLSRTPPTRDELLELLWAPKPGQDVHHRLRTLLHQVRRDIGPDAFRIEGREVVVDRERVPCDAVQFLAHLDAGRLDAAMLLYEAPFLMRGGPSDSPVFEDWAAGVRAELGVAFRTALLREIESGGALDPVRYTSITDLLVDLAPGNPVAAEHALRAALARGDTAAIGEAARLLRTTLGGSGASPSRKTAELLALADAHARPASVSAAIAFDPPFTGRVGELALTRSLLGQTRQSGRGSLIGVAGQSGVGKTRFLGEIERLARIDGMRVLRARAYEVDSRTPYAVLVDALRPLFDEIPMRLVPPGTLEVIGTIIPDLLPPGGSAGSRPLVAEPVQIHSAVASLLECVALDRPLLLLIDDVHWADGQSRACLHRIALRTAGTPLVVAMAFRDAHERLVTPLFAAAPVEMCRLQPLTPAEVEELLVGIASFPDAAQRERLVRTLLASSGGSPLQLIQHLSHLHEVGLVTVREGMWELQGPLLDAAPGAAAEPVVALITRRLEALSDTERTVLAACAVLERYAAPREVAAVAGLGSARIADHLDVLIRQRLIQAEGVLVGVAHAEIGNAALRMIHGHRRQEMFEEALRSAGGNVLLPRSGISNLARLRLACGAGDRQRSRLALLEVFAEALGSGGELLPAVAESVLQSARDWCPSPDFFANLHKDAQRAAEMPGRIDRDIRNIRRRLAAKRRFLRADRLVPAGMLGITAVLILLQTRPNDRAGLRFGGGGLLVLRDSAGNLFGQRVDGPGSADLVLASGGPLRGFDPRRPRAVSPDGHLRLVDCTPEEGGPPDVCIESVDGDDRVTVSPSPGDDRPEGWSPDGRFALIVSDRGPSSVYNYDVYTVELSSGRVRRISHDPYQTDHAMWSPDGTRIAYSSRRPEGSIVVVTTTTGRAITAVEVPPGAGTPVWSPDAKRLAVPFVDLDEQSKILLIDLTSPTTPARTVRISDRLLEPVWSPDGRYVAIPVLGPGRQPETHVLRVDDATDLPVATFKGALLAWVPDRPAPYLDRIEAPDRFTAVEGEVSRVPVVAYAQDGARIEPLHLDFAAADPAVALAAGGDTILAVGAGETTLDVSAGGWRNASVRIQITPAETPQPLLEEDWSKGIDTTRWKRYGSPAATTVDTPDGPAMRNNGDASFPSGVVTRRTFRMDAGLALEWTQSTPLTTGEFWQEIWVDATPLPIDAFGTGEGEPYDTSPTTLAAQTPLIDGQPGVPAVNLLCKPEPVTIPFDPAFAAPGFRRVLVQAYPSGGCDLFLDGRLMARVRPTGPRAWPDSVRIAVGGRSYRADILIGSFRVWRGIVAPQDAGVGRRPE